MLRAGGANPPFSLFLSIRGTAGPGVVGDEEEEEEEEEEEGLFKANALNEEDPERDRATQAQKVKTTEEGDSKLSQSLEELRNSL